MQPTRRDFLRHSIAATLATQAVAAASGAETPKLVPRAGGDLLTRMSWLNPPAHEHYSGGKLEARSKGKTDFWRKTYFGYINDNGHFLHLPVSGEFQFTARVDGNYGAFVDKLAAKLRPSGKLVTAAVGQWYGDRIPASAYATFDFEVSGGDVSVTLSGQLNASIPDTTSNTEARASFILQRRLGARLVDKQTGGNAGDTPFTTSAPLSGTYQLTPGIYRVNVFATGNAAAVMRPDAQGDLELRSAAGSSNYTFTLTVTR